MSISKTHICYALIYVYTTLLVLCLINQIVCYCYYKLGYAQEVRNMLPREIVYPVYDLKTNEVVNADDVTVWDINVFVSENRYKVHKYFNRVADVNGLVDTLSLGLLLVPMIYLFRRTNTKPVLCCVLLVLNLIMVLLFLLVKWIGLH